MPSRITVEKAIGTGSVGDTPNSIPEIRRDAASARGDTSRPPVAGPLRQFTLLPVQTQSSKRRPMSLYVIYVV
jgi:hypothetical protein